MSLSKTWNGNSYSIPETGEFNWQSLTSFLGSLADYAQATTSQKIAVNVNTSSTITVSSPNDCIVVCNPSVSGPVAVTLPPGLTKQVFFIVDGKGEAASYPITITPDGSEQINGASTYVLNVNRAGIGLIYNGTGWTVFGEFGNFTGSSGTIQRSKLAAGTANHVIINDGTGLLSSEAQLASTRGGTGASNVGSLTYGANNIVLTTAGATSVTLPLTGTLATLLGSETLENKTLKSPLITSGSIDVPAAGALAIGASVGANNLTLGGATTTTVIPGNLTIQGTTTTVDTQTLDVKDKNITTNKGGNDASSEGAGLTIDRTGTKGSIIYKDASASKFALGALGAEVDVVDASSSQTLTNKTLSGGTVSNSAVTASSLTVSGATNLNGGTTIGDAAGDALTITSSAVALPNGLNFDSNTLVIDAANNRVGVGVASPTVPLEVSGAAIVGSLTTSSSVAASTDTLDLKPAGTSNASTFISNNVTASGSVKSVTIATNAASGSTTNVIMGSSVAGAINNYKFEGKQAVQLPAGNNSTERPASPADGMIRYNSTDNTYEGYSAAGGGWAAIGGGGAKSTVTQASHGFVVGDILYLNGSTYTDALANAATTAEVVGICSKVIGVNSFELTLSGLVTGITSPASLTPGAVYFLSDVTPALMTVTEPTVIGSVSVPLGVAVTTTSIYFAPKRGMVVGGANARTQINLANNTASQDVQDVSLYDAGELAGWVLITNSTAANSLRFYVKAPFAKYGGSSNYYISPSYVGDTPPAGFLMTVTAAGKIQVSMPNVSGYASAVINFALNAPAVGTNFPLSVDAASITSGTVAAARLPSFAPTQTKYTSGSGTYTVPAGVKWLRVRMVGGGGGGGGGATGATGGAGGAGGSTTFGSSFLTCTGGSGGVSGSGGQSTGTAGGTATINAGAFGFSFSGGTGSLGAANSTSTAFTLGGSGGNSCFASAGSGGFNNGAGTAAAVNSGSGGGGGACSNASGSQGGAGGGAGAFLDVTISSPGASYSYAVGSSGTAGTAGTNGQAGGVGGAGLILIDEFYY